MTGSFDSNPKNFGELLGQYEKLPLNVPQFQRGYSWEKSHVAAFWEDIKNFSEAKGSANAGSTYFLGPIVIIPQDTEQILLDGQQRLATATILFAVIRDIARSEVGTDKAKDLARDIQRDLIYKDEDNSSFSLTLGELDNDFFRRSVQNDPPMPASISLRSHRAIEAARQFLHAAVTQIIKDKKADDQVKVLKTLKDTVATDLVMVAIIVDSEDDAYHIFETLNDRGLRLSVPDLLLNFLMRKAENATKRKALRTTWNAMMEKMGRKDVDRFLRHMWLSKCGDLKARGLFHEIKHHIDAKKIKSIDFADMCLIECTSYLSIIEPDQDKLEQAYPHVSGLVRYLQIAPALPLLLSGIRTLKPTNFTKLAQMAASIALRHAVVANLNPSDLESAFYKSARMLRELKEGGATDAKALREVRNELARLNPPDTTVIPAFASLEVSKPQAQYILSIIAKSIQSKTKEITLEAPTLEHIYPEHPGPDWAQSDLKESDVWQIGNLTLLGKGPNEKAGNFAFPVKCNMPPPKSR